jgi:hypothetical protein
VLAVLGAVGQAQLILCQQHSALPILVAVAVVVLNPK